MQKHDHLCFIFTFFDLEHSRLGHSLMKKKREEKEERGRSEDKEDQTKLQRPELSGKKKRPVIAQLKLCQFS